MSKNELVAKIEALNEWEAVIEEAKAPTANCIRNTPNRAPAAAFPSAPKEKPLVRPADQSKRTKSFPPIQTERARTL